MANQSLIRVNQKLAQARALLKQDISNLSVVHVNANIEAAAFHMVCAYQHYLRELTETYGLKHANNIQNEADLLSAFRAANKHPAEAEELSTLRGNLHSWLSRLNAYYDSLWRKPEISADHHEDDSLIRAVNLDDEISVPEVTLEIAALWHAAFIDLVTRQRETSAEF